MASPAAYQPPTIEASWGAFVAHIPTLLLIWLLSSLFSGLGLLAMLAIQAGGLGLVLWGQSAEALSPLTTATAQLGQVPFAILAAMVGVLFTAVPALHYSTGEVITAKGAISELLRRPGRYLSAGVLFGLVTTLGTLLCVLPGVAMLLVMPVYVNLIFTGDRPILDAFQASFQVCYGTSQGRSFLLVELLTWLVVISVSLCTCFVGGLVAGPMGHFYLQNAAYQRGVLR